MKKFLVLSAAVLFGVSAQAGILDVYNAIDTETNENSTLVDKKAAALKSKIASKTSSLQAKADTTTAEKEELKATLESKLAELTAKGEGKSSAALEIKNEIEALQRLIDAAKK